MHLSLKEIELLCKAGATAPSGGNVQPWVVDAYSNAFVIRLDPIRSVSFLDVGRYASLLSLGCFIENVVIASKQLGLETKITNYEISDISKPVVEIKFLYRLKTNKSDLYNFIFKRCTNRKISDGSLIPNELIDEFNTVAKNIDKNFNFIGKYNYYEKKQLAKVLGKADVIRNTHEESFRQMMNEFRWTGDEVKKTCDGIDIKTLELPKYAAKGLLLLKQFPHLRKIIPKQSFEELAKPILEESSHICFLNSSNNIDSKTMITIGRALERIWLTATKYHLSVQPWTIISLYMIRVKFFSGKGFNDHEILEIRNLEKDLRKILNINKNEIPVFIFRLSKSDPPTAHSLRRNWQDFTRFHKELL